MMLDLYGLGIIMDLLLSVVEDKEEHQWMVGRGSAPIILELRKEVDEVER